MIKWHNRIFALAVAFLIGFVLTGCASVGSDDASWKETQKQRLKDRAEARWEAVIKGDYEKAYGFMSPDYRNVVSLQQYKTRMGRAVEWRLARTEEIRYDSLTVASVMMGVTYRTDLPGARGKQFENSRVLTEKWLFKDGEWWYIDQ